MQNFLIMKKIILSVILTLLVIIGGILVKGAEAVIAIAPINTNTGGNPKYTSDKIPIGINNPVRASHEIDLTLLSLSLKCRSK